MLLTLAYLILFTNLEFLDPLLGGSNEISIDGIKYIPILALALFHRVLKRNHNAYAQVSIDIVPILIYVLALFISIIWAVSVSYYIRTLLPWITIVLLIALLQKTSPQNLRRFEKQLIILSTVSLIICALNFIYGLADGGALVKDSSGTERLALLNWLPAWYAHYIVISGIVFYYAWRYKRKAIFFLLFSVIITVLLFMNIRAYLLGCLGAILIVEIILLRGMSRKIFAVMIGLTVVASMIAFYEPLHTKMYISDDSSLIDSDNIRLSDRDKIAAYLIGKSYEYSNLVMGAGAGAARFFLQSSKIFDNTMYSHSDYVRITTELGLVGLFLYVIVLFLMFRKATNVYKIANITGDASAKIYGASAISVVVFLGLAGFVYDIFTPLNIAFFYALLFIGRNRSMMIGRNGIISSGQILAHHSNAVLKHSFSRISIK